MNKKLRAALYWGSLTLAAALVYYSVFHDAWIFNQPKKRVHYTNAVHVEE